MSRYFIYFSYDGAAYHGWQVQPNGVTVQQVVQDAFEAVTGVRVGVTGCSRTDAGVHADMFCCAVDSDTPLRGDKLCSALNFHLPRDVSVYDAREVAEDFHPGYTGIRTENNVYTLRVDQLRSGLEDYVLRVHCSGDNGGNSAGIFTIKLKQ
jgi:tRNA pseudouridine38-40 synthase